MIDLFMPFRSFLKFDNVCTDNNVFRMHYKITVIMLLVFTLLVTSKQFFGEPIHCIAEGEHNDKDAVNSYCWIYGTYTLKSNLYGIEGKNMAYPGVGPNRPLPPDHHGEVHKDEQIKHRYYQWVCFVLLGQAVMFYIPRYLWKIWEGGRLKVLAGDLANPMVSKDWSEYRRVELLSYLSYTNLHTHNMYALRYAFCELLNLVNVVGQIFLIDIFLGGAFRNYGAAVVTFTQMTRVSSDGIYANVSPMDQYFPKLTKCTLRTYGPSGSLQEKDRLCVLPLNIVNEKIFVILWFWLLILTFLSTMAVLFRIMVFSLRPLRSLMIVGQLRYVKKSTVNRIIRRFGFGDWFILYLLGKNMNPQIYKELIIELAKEMEQKTITI